YRIFVLFLSYVVILNLFSLVQIKRLLLLLLLCGRFDTVFYVQDLQDHSVEWIKEDMKHFVFLYLRRKIITEHMNESFILKVSLDQDGLKRGDVTLKIRNVSLQDEGKYSCFIPGKNFRETVQLVVGEFALQVLPHMKNICPEQRIFTLDYLTNRISAVLFCQVL
uniref:Ig-like domain-containing protein n=1 Tax=Oryzias latipes TaxID=8090 RepID=A0A3P9LHM0_ORYLA